MLKYTHELTGDVLYGHRATLATKVELVRCTFMGLENQKGLANNGSISRIPYCKAVLT